MLIQCKENGAVLDNYSNLSNPIFPLAVLWSSPSPSAGFCSKSRARSSCETSKKVFVRHSDYNTNYVLILLHSYLEENIVGTEKREMQRRSVAQRSGVIPRIHVLLSATVQSLPQRAFRFVFWLLSASTLDLSAAGGSRRICTNHLSQQASRSSTPGP